MPTTAPAAPSLLRSLSGLVAKAAAIWLDLLKIMVPIILAVKVLQELGAIRYLAVPLTPLMQLVGLPPEMGLAWAAALLNNIYAGIFVILTLLPDTPLTAAQATVLTTMFLVAHNLPVETQVARRCGAAAFFQVALRFLGALALGAILNQVYTSFHLLQEPARIFLAPQADDPTLLAWALGQAKSLAKIFCIILALLSLMRLLDRLGITPLLDRLLRPLLRLVRIGPTASQITIIGLSMGIAYGGGLIIAEARSGRLPPRDVVLSLSLMGLSHSLIEDTLLCLAVGGHFSGTLLGRLAFTLALMAVITRFVPVDPGTTPGRWAWKGIPAKA